ncbi:MAG: thymidylate synthase [Nanoarchaeota archaeon]|nr:thymidylate synthase [Nanoarchaeota archaeon]
MKFEPQHHQTKLKVINPEGCVGVVTLWSPVLWVSEKFTEFGIDLSNNSKIVCFGQLYGDGLGSMLRNLLYNPQIKHLIVCGDNRSNSYEDLVAFFEAGVEDYDWNGIPMKRIIGRERLLDKDMSPGLFTEPLKITYLGSLIQDNFSVKLKQVLASINLCNKDSERKDIPVPELNVQSYPSEARSHVIFGKKPVEAWINLVHRIFNFGKLIHLRKGPRCELQNVKVIIQNPADYTEEELVKFGFSITKVKAYQEKILKKDLEEGSAYTYGNRIGAHFGIDCIQAVVDKLNLNPKSRRAYITLWDPANDLTTPKSVPCFLSIYFRKFEDKLTMTATFRSHNGLDAWLMNLFGLKAILDTVAKATNIVAGPITVFSHSMTINPDKYEYAKTLADNRTVKYLFHNEHDAAGYSEYEVESGEMVVKFFSDGIQIREYRGTNSELLRKEIERDCAILSIGHALYVGHMIAKLEQQLK